MNNILERIRRKQQSQRSKSQQPTTVEIPAPKREKTIPPHIVVCKVCEGKGMNEGVTCPQCNVSAYVPENEV